MYKSGSLVKTGGSAGESPPRGRAPDQTHWSNTGQTLVKHWSNDRRIAPSRAAALTARRANSEYRSNTGPLVKVGRYYWSKFSRLGGRDIGRIREPATRFDHMFQAGRPRANVFDRMVKAGRPRRVRCPVFARWRRAPVNGQTFGQTFDRMVNDQSKRRVCVRPRPVFDHRDRARYGVNLA